MNCLHPMGFIVADTEAGTFRCFDCKESTPGLCVCGAPYLTPACLQNSHLRGPRVAAMALPPTGPEHDYSNRCPWCCGPCLASPPESDDAGRES